MNAGTTIEKYSVVDSLKSLYRERERDSVGGEGGGDGIEKENEKIIIIEGENIFL